MKSELEEIRDKKFIGTVQLADEAARLISRLVPKQGRGSVSELPDERTVRYYSAEGLISPPEARQGTASVYGYEHLLQLLVIKRLQAEHLPIRKIKELVEGKGERDLERLLDIGGAGGERAGPNNAATEYLRSLLRPAAPKPATTKAQRTASPTLPPATTTSSAWARVEVEPGLELHIREDYRLPDDAKGRKLLARRMLNEIESYGVKPRK